MKERKKTTLHLVCIFADVGYSSCVLSSLPCFCTFFGSIPTSNQVLQKFFFPSDIFMMAGRALVYLPDCHNKWLSQNSSKRNS